MSDLEDLDHEPEDIHLEEEELSAPADNPSEGAFSPPKSGGNATLLKIAAVIVVLAGGGGAYFFMSSHHAAAPKQVADIPPLPHRGAHGLVDSSAPKSEKMASAEPAPWGGSTAPAPVPAAAPPPVANIPVPAAIGSLPSATSAPAPIQASGQPVPASPAMPPIVNDLPPPTAQLTNVGGAPSLPGMPSAVPTMPSSPSSPSSPFAASAQPSLPGMPEPSSSMAPSTVPSTAPAPAEKPVLAAGLGAAPMPPQPVKAPETKSDLSTPSMPPTAMPAVDKMGIGKSQMTMTSSAPAAETAKVEVLEKKITELEKTISDLQQAAVVKKDGTEKSAEESDVEKTATEEAVPAHKKHHRVSSAHHSKSRHLASHHMVAPKWVLKAAKPGVAWVARKGTDDLRMVETGDSLMGIGTVTAIIRNSSGYWVVNGTKGRISQ